MKEENAQFIILQANFPMDGHSIGEQTGELWKEFVFMELDIPIPDNSLIGKKTTWNLKQFMAVTAAVVWLRIKVRIY